MMYGRCVLCVITELLLKLGELCGTPVSHVRCQLPTEDLDALVSITSDEDLANLIEEYDKSPLKSSLKIRAFLSLPKSKSPITTPSSSSSSSSPPQSLYASTSSPKSYSYHTSSKRASIPCHHHRCPPPPTPPSSTRKIVSPHPQYGYYAPPGQQIYLVRNTNHWQ